MSVFRPKKEDFVLIESPDGKEHGLRKEVFDSYNPSILGLGNVNKEALPYSTISAIFDLQGFTNYCKQIDPELSVPIFLSAWLDWIFNCIKDETTKKTLPDGVTLWHELPFYSKFLGDGLLLLWDSKSMSPVSQHNLIISLRSICEKYVKIFLPSIQTKVVEPPSLLRCGIAKGTVLSVGDGKDYVGSCINLAARLQKLPGLSVSFCRRGFDPETYWKNKVMEKWILMKVPIRGIGGNELIYLTKTDYENMSDEDREFYHSPL